MYVYENDFGKGGQSLLFWGGRLREIRQGSGFRVQGILESRLKGPRIWAMNLPG